MAKTVTTPWDPADHLKTDEDMAAYLEAALEDSDPTLVAAALGDTDSPTQMIAEKAAPWIPLGFSGGVNPVLIF